VRIIPALKDNYIYMLKEAGTNNVAIIDAPDATPILDILKADSLRLKYILNTHHHWDHTDGNKELKEATGCEVVGYKGDAERIPEIDIKVEDEKDFEIFGEKVTPLFVPGHTSGAVSYYIKNLGIIFTGDTLFSMGCGRLFEGTPQQMFESLNKLASLPPETKIYSGHEYAKNNAEFALKIEGENDALKKRYEEVCKLESEGKTTQPSSVELELKTNPFLRTASEEIRKSVGVDQSDVAVFAKVRELRNSH